MKKKFYIILTLIIGVFVIFLFVKQFMTNDSSTKATVNLTVYTTPTSETQKWNKVEKLETEKAIYLVTAKEVASVEEIFSNIIADGAAVGFGVSKTEVSQYNDNLGDTVEDSKDNKLIGLEYLTFSTDNEGFVIANFDYGDKEFNSQKEGKEELYKKLYEAYKSK
ncbi:hypothetical protein [Streptococcus saliviloxodontae]|uniref:Lipoprotein n=1 Tax=Streptococcus saliviloxodontae TaxID=1349416 RepID=A0ABS2PNK3_9STRE|nr:hypothetical protein [Streptococcus saliviloxodontae]MBM7637010.1 hypothetical protein [Streptococcus saliviloxodontae]